MPTLIVTPIDYSAAGSYVLRRRVLKASKKINDAIEQEDGMATIEAALEIEDVLLDRVKVKGKGTVEKALAEISANDFDSLLGALLESPVPTENGSSSKNGEPEPEK